jgi:competence protein ComEC
MFNVGAGEAVLLVFPGRRAWLVEAGCNSSKRNEDLAAQLLAYLKTNRLVLDSVVLSHAHSDHAGAVATILAAAPSPNLAPEVTIYRRDHHLWRSTKGWRKHLQDAIGNAGAAVSVVEWRHGHREISVSEDVTAHLFVGAGGDVYTSMFLQLRFHRAQLLFTGDAHCPYEQKLLDEFGEADFRADVLKVTHHGSSNGTAAGVVKHVKPGLAIASTGSDQHHTLELDTIERLGGLEGKREILETVTAGDIILRTDGRKYLKGVLYQVDFDEPGQFVEALRVSSTPAEKTRKPGGGCVDPNP